MSSTTLAALATATVAAAAAKNRGLLTKDGLAAAAKISSAALPKAERAALVLVLLGAVGAYSRGSLTKTAVRALRSMPVIGHAIDAILHSQASGAAVDLTEMDDVDESANRDRNLCSIPAKGLTKEELMAKVMEYVTRGRGAAAADVTTTTRVRPPLVILLLLARPLRRHRDRRWPSSSSWRVRPATSPPPLLLSPPLHHHHYYT